jgi:hypothetical protein
MEFTPGDILAGVLSNLKVILDKENVKQDEFMAENCYMYGSLFFETGIIQYSEKLCMEYKRSSILVRVFMNRKVYDEFNATVNKTASYLSNDEHLQTILYIMNQLESEIKVVYVPLIIRNYFIICENDIRTNIFWFCRLVATR